MRSYFKENFYNDFLSSVVVFLVALPLCMGIALASGVDPIVGLLSGIIGGIVVGTFAGSPLQVSGPAAGLAVMVFQFVEKYGVESLVPLGIIAGIFQIIMYRFKLAQYFRAMSPALIKGMLAGIGLLILISQMHIALLNKPGGNGLNNILELPGIFMTNLFGSGVAQVSFGLALSVVFLIFVWQKFFPKLNKKFPAPLFAILAASALANFAGLRIDFVKIPNDILAEIHFISLDSFSNFSFGLVFSAIAIAFVASAESLLCVNAVDKMSGEKSDYNQEIFAQGLGNVVAGMVGALPLTGVIVRSSANLESGGKTRGAAVMHGIWLFCLVFFLPQVLELIPIAALAGILIYTGLKLLNLKAIPAMIKEDKKEALVFLLTLGLITTTDLLTGVIIGFVISLFVLMSEVMKLDIKQEEQEGGELKVVMQGKATFLHIPKISKELVRLTDLERGDVTIDLSNVAYVDNTIIQELNDWADEGSEAEKIACKRKIKYPKVL